MRPKRSIRAKQEPLLWRTLTAFMTIGALRTTKVLFFIFLAIDFLFVGLALSAFGVAREATHMLAAVSELVISLLSFYCAGANILNNHFGEQFLSLGNPFWSKKTQIDILIATVLP